MNEDKRFVNLDLVQGPSNNSLSKPDAVRFLDNSILLHASV